jgi:hypothetical protein
MSCEEGKRVTVKLGTDRRSNLFCLSIKYQKYAHPEALEEVEGFVGGCMQNARVIAHPAASAAGPRRQHLPDMGKSGSDLGVGLRHHWFTVC